MKAEMFYNSSHNKRITMMNKNLLIVALLVSGAASAHTSLKDQLAAKSEKINTTKNDIRAGKFMDANAGCRTKGCNRCNKCRH